MQIHSRVKYNNIFICIPFGEITHRSDRLTDFPRLMAQTNFVLGEGAGAGFIDMTHLGNQNPQNPYILFLGCEGLMSGRITWRIEA